MKLLKDILYRAGIEEVVGSTNVAIENVCIDSREAKKFSLFIAVRGTLTDGHAYIEKAIEQGALAIVCEELPKELKKEVNYVQVKNSRYAAGVIASNFFDNPSQDLKLVGVTGTNGKTTTATLLYELFRALGYKVGLISTVRNLINDTVVAATHTTPDPINLNRLLAEMVDSGCEFCFMEVSSHALDQHRVAGIEFAGAIFTNITHDHLDYHQTFSNYIKAKKMLFDGLSSKAFALVNVDDKNGEVMVQNTKAKIVTYGLKSMADRKAKILENNLTGLILNIDGQEVITRLIGSFNAYNILSVYGAALELKEEKLQILTTLSNLHSPDGRFQFIKTENNILGIVDYAHTPDALDNVLSTIHELRTGNEKLVTLVGCGGDRDKTKRPEMARIAAEGSDKVILTSDNPRSEDPLAIIEDMKAGLDPVLKKKAVTIIDRAEAIRTACMLVQPGDIILVAGKGHEKYQEIKGIRTPFDDMEVLTTNLKQIH
ncbi:MAG: UDP-N-acetylmuramoyl-L-alanyl-D-glutamate--2,6-diaminopimelate ligase [Flavobacteriales bacterium]|nr:UDP-N-acetylmuramoyl-L-alanyl-D-glutamate--2,6-diaminopimelate ligase [Flavobacteriales bacterium]